MPLFRTQSAAEQTSLAPHDSKARLLSDHDSQGFMAKPCTPHPHCAARAVIQAANPQWRGQGAGPLAFSWGYKGDILSRERISPLLWAAPSALPSPRTFVQKIKKRRLFQPSLLYLHYCKTFLLPWVAFMRSSLLRIVLRMRRFLGVTSSSSSSARNSRHCSRLICLGGTQR